MQLQTTLSFVLLYRLFIVSWISKVIMTLFSIPDPLESCSLYRSCHLSEIGFWSHLVRVLVALYDHHGRYIHGKPGGLPDGHSHQETCQQPGGTSTVQRYHSAHTKLNKPTDIVRGNVTLFVPLYRLFLISGFPGFPRLDAYLLFDQIFPKTCMKMKLLSVTK